MTLLTNERYGMHSQPQKEVPLRSNDLQTEWRPRSSKSPSHVSKRRRRVGRLVKEDQK